MDKKLIFFDIDGTIYDHDKRIPDTAKQAVSDLKAQGHHVFIASGRAPFMVRPVLEELGIDSFVSYNGQYVVFEGEVIYKNPIAEQSLEALLAHSDSCGHPLVFMGEEGMRSTTAGHPFVHEGIGSLKVNPPVGTFFRSSCSVRKTRKSGTAGFRSLISSAGTSALQMCCLLAVRKRKESKKSLKSFRSTERILTRSETV